MRGRGGGEREGWGGRGEGGVGEGWGGGGGRRIKKAKTTLVTTEGRWWEGVHVHEAEATI